MRPGGVQVGALSGDQRVPGARAGSRTLGLPSAPAGRRPAFLRFRCCAPVQPWCWYQTLYFLRRPGRPGPCTRVHTPRLSSRRVPTPRPSPAVTCGCLDGPGHASVPGLRWDARQVGRRETGTPQGHQAWPLGAPHAFSALLRFGGAPHLLSESVWAAARACDGAEAAQGSS